MPVICDQDTGKSYIFKNYLIKCILMKRNESFLKLGHEWCALPPAHAIENNNEKSLNKVTSTLFFGTGHV